MLGLFNFLKGSFQEKDGKTSGRRLTAFWFVVLTTLIIISVVLIVYALIFKEAKRDDFSIRAVGVLNDTMYITCGMILLLFGVITVQDITKFKAGVQADAEPPKNVTEIKTDSATINNNAGDVG